MASLKEEAIAQPATQIKNVAELDILPLDLELQTGKGTDENGTEFQYKYVEVKGEKYRIAGKVIGDIKAILETAPTCTKVKVVRKGTGLQTQYTTIPLA